MTTFLIADDSDGKRVFLEALVQKSGIAEEVLTATSTEGAKELIDSNTVDAAFIDYEMPSEQGPAVIAYLREKNPSAKIAMVSSGNSDRYRSDATEAGADAYVYTSFEEDTVIENLTDL
ncbi:MAG: response regulator, partial [Candidatus Peribacteraceae bacterium]|nr:response regulator [Candidatus Peribacteraceae bacterium]